MNKNNHHLIIMAGGKGTRCWPLSRQALPKQFQDFIGEGQTLLQETVIRFKSYIPIENIWIVTHYNFRDLVAHQLPSISESRILLEPFSNNTASSIAYACYTIAQKNLYAKVIITPSDHYISTPHLLYKTVQEAFLALEKEDKLITIGVACKKPEIGYGYMELVPKHSETSIQHVMRFVEKPTLQQAAHYIAQKNYVWNTGICVSTVSLLRQYYQEHLPAISDAFETIQYKLSTSTTYASIMAVYKQLPNISFDYGILEKVHNLYCAVSEMIWSDLGSWQAWEELFKKDEHNNILQGNVAQLNTTGCIVKNNANTLIATYGITDQIIIQHDNVILICPKKDAQKVKELVDNIAKTHKEFL